MDIRALASVFAMTEGGDIVWTAHASTLNMLEDSWIRSQFKGLATEVATLFPNLAISDVRRNSDDAGLTILSAASQFLNVTTTSDAQLPLLCKVSTCILRDTISAILGTNGGSGTVKQAAQQ
ncbi:hypothetical protein EV175_006621, partial [Coemansia sp. RSA 1933]